jgi:hypothetical protein
MANIQIAEISVNIGNLRGVTLASHVEGFSQEALEKDLNIVYFGIKEFRGSRFTYSDFFHHDGQTKPYEFEVREVEKASRSGAVKLGGAVALRDSEEDGVLSGVHHVSGFEVRGSLKERVASLWFKNGKDELDEIVRYQQSAMQQHLRVLRYRQRQSR